MQEVDRTHLSHGSFTSLGPDGSNLLLYLLHFLFVSPTLVVWYLSFQLVNLLLILPESITRRESSTDGVTIAQVDLTKRGKAVESKQNTRVVNMMLCGYDGSNKADWKLVGVAMHKKRQTH